MKKALLAIPVLLLASCMAPVSAASVDEVEDYTYICGLLAFDDKMLEDGNTSREAVVEFLERHNVDITGEECQTEKEERAYQLQKKGMYGKHELGTRNMTFTNNW